MTQGVGWPTDTDEAARKAAFFVLDIEGYGPYLSPLEKRKGYRTSA